MQLTKAMESMGPMMKTITPMVEQLKGMMGTINDDKAGMGGMLDLAKKMSSQSAPAK